MAEKRPFTAYNGFDPSGRIHIVQAVITVLNANTIIESGGEFIIYIADWFAQINGKMGGDLNKIKEVSQYFIEVFRAMGISSKVKFVWTSEFIQSNPHY